VGLPVATAGGELPVGIFAATVGERYRLSLLVKAGPGVIKLVEVIPASRRQQASAAAKPTSRGNPLIV